MDRVMSKQDNSSRCAFYRLGQGHEDVRDGRSEDVEVVKTRARAQGVSQKEKVRHRKCYIK